MNSACTHCGGEGYVKEAMYEDDLNELRKAAGIIVEKDQDTENEDACSNCGGSGKHGSDDTCPMCD